MNDLVQWLTAQLDHDEQVALRWQADRRSWKTVGLRNVRYPNGSEQVAAIDVSGRAGDWWEQIWIKRDLDGLAEHVALHDPARALRQVAAHRQVVAEYGRAMDSRRAHRDTASAGALLMAVGTLKLIASIYSDRPGYDPSWTADT